VKQDRKGAALFGAQPLSLSVTRSHGDALASLPFQKIPVILREATRSISIML
jgi:hypothetical protein